MRASRKRVVIVVFLVCVVVGLPSGIYLHHFGTRTYPRFRAIDRWEVVIEAGAARPDKVVLVLTRDLGDPAEGFVAWRSDNGTLVRQVVDATIGFPEWPRRTVLALGDGEPVSGQALDDVLTFEKVLKAVCSTAQPMYGHTDILVYIQDGESRRKYWTQHWTLRGAGALERFREATRPLGSKAVGM